MSHIANMNFFSNAALRDRPANASLRPAWPGVSVRSWIPGVITALVLTGALVLGVLLRVVVFTPGHLTPVLSVFMQWVK